MAEGDPFTRVAFRRDLPFGFLTMESSMR